MNQADHHQPEQEQQRETRIDDLLAEYFRRIDEGETVDGDQLAGGDAELIHELKDLIGTSKLIEALAGPEVTQEWNFQDTIHSDSTWVAPSFPAEADPATGPSLPRRFGSYVLLAELGRGGMGVVFKARQLRMDRFVAVKMLRAGHLATAEDLQRFYTEAQAAGKLGHPSIVSVHQVGEVDGHPFYSMDYIQGETLADLAARKQLDDQQIARHLIEVADAVQYAHDSGIVHRDLKPANVLIGTDDRPHITDFGLAKLVESDADLTATGAALGTPSYMSPEQAAGISSEVGRATDIYSLGAILYALLTGRPPFRGKTVPDTIMQVIHEEPVLPRIRRPGVNRDLQTICLKCLQKIPSDRYPSASALRDDLQRFLDGQQIAAKPASRIRQSTNWVRQIPLVAALTGRRSHQPSPWQWRVNLGLILMPVILLLALATNTLYQHSVLPPRLRVASAPEGGQYHRFCVILAGHLSRQAHRNVKVLTTAGSGDNYEHLLHGEAELALVQSSVLHGDGVSVLAPMYDDLIHVMVRTRLGIESMDQLAGRRIAIGLPGSGMQLSARKVVGHYYPQGGVELHEVHFVDLSSDQQLDGAIVTTGTDNEDLRRLLAAGHYRLLPLLNTDPLVGPVYRPRQIPPGLYKQATADDPVAVPDHAVRTLASTTFLAVPTGAPDLWATTVLEVIYQKSDIARQFDLFPLDQADEWAMLDLHPAARRFFAARPEAAD